MAHSFQRERVSKDLSPKRGIGAVARTMDSVRKASDWWFRTGPVSTQSGGREMEATEKKWGEERAASLAKESARELLVSPLWALTHLNCKYLSWLRRR